MLNILALLGHELDLMWTAPECVLRTAHTHIHTRVQTCWQFAFGSPLAISQLVANIQSVSNTRAVCSVSPLMLFVRGSHHRSWVDSFETDTLTSKLHVVKLETFESEYTSARRAIDVILEIITQN